VPGAGARGGAPRLFRPGIHGRLTGSSCQAVLPADGLCWQLPADKRWQGRRCDSAAGWLALKRTRLAAELVAAGMHR
jgi:hypothetical protein